jgi:AhpD family alkylhydroperoxidase
VCLAVSAINGCEMCVQSHEKVVIEGGLTEDHVNDAVRIAATVHAAAVGFEMQPPNPLVAAALDTPTALVPGEAVTTF